MVIIGVDPHPDTHTAAALDENGKVLSSLTITNTKAGHKKLHRWARQYPDKRWAIEGANNAFATNLSYPLADQEAVVDVTPSLTSQYRSKRGKTKTDTIDAVNIARVLLANPKLPRFTPTLEIEQLKELVRTRERLAEQLKANRMALRGATRGSVAFQVLDVLVEGLKVQLHLLGVHLRALVERLMPELLTLRGIGLVHSATILAEVGGVEWFRSADAFASYWGCAPIERSSGRNRHVRVNPGGNRRLNRACYLIAMVRLRTCERSRELVERKQSEGKTFRAALRVLKTYIAREVYQCMRRAQAPGGAIGPCS